MNAQTELGMHGGTALKAFKLKGEAIRRGDSITAEMLNGLSPRQIRSFEGAGLVKYFTKASDETQVLVKPKLKRKKRRVVYGNKTKGRQPN